MRGSHMNVSPHLSGFLFCFCGLVQRCVYLCVCVCVRVSPGSNYAAIESRLGVNYNI